MDKEKIEQAVSMIIEAIGENPNREGVIGNSSKSS